MEDLNLKNVLEIGENKFLVSTIATPIRHTWFEDEMRIVYETMIFEFKNEDVDYSHPLFNERYHNEDEAMAEHFFIIKNPDVFLPKK